MSKNTGKYIEIFSHVLFWVLPTYFSIRFNLMSFGQGLENEYARNPFIAGTLINIVMVYSIMFLLFPVYNRKQISLLQFNLIILIGVIIISYAKVKIDDLFSLYYFKEIKREISFSVKFWVENFITAFFAVQSVLYCIVKEWIRNKNIKARLIEEKFSLELKYLKAQINPHFLFNTLNNLYSLALKNNDNETAIGISRLSYMMRFMLDESNDTILLNKEIEYLNSYIDLQKLRFSEKDDIRITFIIKGGTENIMIPPFLFIVFIENAFKYGINFKKPSFIDVQFEIDCESLKFHVKNSVHIKNETEKQGIGLVNVKERLKLLYKEDQSLKIINDIGTFNVDLIIKLNHVK